MNKGSMNKVILAGRLGKDPEQTQTPSGLVISKFSLATTDSRKDHRSGEWVDITEWHNCVAFGKTAEYINNYVRKGRLVAIEGKLRISTWEKDGIKRYKTDIIIDQLIALDKAPITDDVENTTQTYPQSTNAQQDAIPNRQDGDNVDNEGSLPF